MVREARSSSDSRRSHEPKKLVGLQKLKKARKWIIPEILRSSQLFQDLDYGNRFKISCIQTNFLLSYQAHTKH